MNAPLTQQQRTSLEALPMAWIDRLFARFSAMYGAKFTSQWQGVDVAVLKATWAEDLAGYTGEEIAAGIASCKTRPFPPTLPEFLGLCRPVVQIDNETLFHQACACAMRRKYGEPENWPSNRLFWAYQRIGGDLLGDRTNELRKRFAAAYIEAAADESKPIPQASQVAALPAPGKTTLTREEAEARTKQIGLKLGSGQASKGFSSVTAWAYAIANDPGAVPTISIEKAIKAFIAWGVEIPQKLADYIETKGLQKLMPEA